MATRSTSRKRLLTLSLSAILVLALVVGNASANTEVAGHEIEADLETNTIPNGDTDWAPNNATEPGGTAGNGAETALFTSATACPATNTGRPSAQTNDAEGATLLCDSISFPGEKDANVFTGGAKEDDPNSQTTTSSSVTPKTDLTNAYARGVINGGNDAWVIAAYEVIPKQGSYHTNVEFNQKVRCVTQDIIVDQASDCDADEQVVPFRSPGDALLAVDIGGSNDPDKKIQLAVFIATDHDGDPATNAVYDFPKGNETNEEKADFAASGANAIDTAVAKVFLNGATIDCGPWGCYNENYQFVSQLPAEAFVETAFNISAFSDNVCLNNVAFKSRASGQSITSQLKDTTDEQPFPFCGGLSVRKYIDSNESGAEDANDVAPVGTDLAGWNFTVTGPAPATDVVCSGTTDSSGDLVCSTGDLTQLAPGDYTITETTAGKALDSNGATSVNTDPAPPSTSKVVTVGLGGSIEAVFGNTCLITKHFEVTGVPSGTTGLFARYDTTVDGAVDDSPVTVALSDQGDGTWTGTATDLFEIDGGLDLPGVASTLEWEYGVTGSSEFVGSETFGTSDGYPNCERTNTVAFAPPTLTVNKFKDMTADGLDTGDTQGLANWQFKLWRDGGDASFGGDDTLIETLTTGTDGSATNSVALAPGLYHVEELTQTNWTNTTPGTDPPVISVQLDISDTDTVNFANTPEAKFTILFDDLTGSTDATIECDKVADGNSEPITPESIGSQTGDDYDSGNVLVGEYDCHLVITDP